MGKPSGREMLRRLIQFFANETRGNITKTQMVKFLYLSDLYAVKWTGAQLTDLDWRFYHHGPWEESIDEMLGEMEAQRAIFINRIGGAHMVTPTKSAPSTRELGLPRSLRLTLENIRREWAGQDREHVDALLEYVYSTAPMMAVKNKHQREEKVRLDLNLEREAMHRAFGEI